MENGPLIKAKVVVVGDGGVGKTSLAVRFTDDSFSDHYKQTVGASFCSRSLIVKDTTILFQIWDTAGQERFRSLVPMYLRDAVVALVVYDISDKRTYHDVDDWIKQLQQYGPDNLKCALIGNKNDLEDHFRDVTTEVHVYHNQWSIQKSNVISVTFAEGASLADSHNLYFAETSAKTGYGVVEVFNDIGTSLVSGPRKDERQRPRSTIPICDSIVNRRAPRKCCNTS